MSVIPQTLFNTTLFVDGVSLQGDVPTFDLPKVTIKTEAYRGGGMDGEIDQDMGIEKLDGAFTTNGIRRETLQHFGVFDATSTPLVFRAAFKEQKGKVVPVVATVRGLVKEIDTGSWAVGSKAEIKHTINCSYYKLEVDGRVIYEIDPVNMVRVIDGVDQLAAVRTALGV